MDKIAKQIHTVHETTAFRGKTEKTLLFLLEIKAIGRNKEALPPEKPERAPWRRQPMHDEDQISRHAAQYSCADLKQIR